MTTISGTTSTDRRVRRTKQLLMHALFTLMKEKSYNDITVKELCEAADINRGTFYLHYRDIYDMVEQIEQDMLFQFEALISAHAPTSPNAAPDLLTLRYVPVCGGKPHALYCPARQKRRPFFSAEDQRALTQEAHGIICRQASGKGPDTF